MVLGAATLFFGCRARDQDYIYAAELAEFVRSGALSALHVAFSREGADKDYVQHHMAREAAVAELLMVRQSCEFYVLVLVATVWCPRFSCMGVLGFCDKDHIHRHPAKLLMVRVL